MTKYEYNKKYIANNRDLVNQRRREKYKQDKLNNPVDKPKQIRRRKPIEDKKTKDIKAYQKAYQKEYRLKNKEKIAERQKLYVQKNNDKIAKQKSDWQKEHRIKKVKEKTIKPIKLKVKKQKNYLNNDDLLQQIILCKAQGSISPELVNMIQKIANGISQKLYYDDLEDKKDCIQEGITQMILNYHKFNENKYNNPFAYLSEICKRGFIKQYNELRQIKQLYILGTNKNRKTEMKQIPIISCEWL